MRYYLAPMEGITGYLFRQAQQEFFRPMDQYFTPFLAPNQNRCMNTRERKEVLPEHNRGKKTVPQILTNRAEDFLRTCRELQELGYSEVNLNLGCPSGTVAAKKRGAGFLGVPEELQRFLEQIFDKAEVKISVKTRLGIEDPEEFFPIIKIYNQYPLEELIIHPRVQKDFYKKKPRLEVFREAAGQSRAPVCYNGDLFTPGDLHRFRKEFPEIGRVMIGRGAIVNPGFLNCIPEENVKGLGITKEQMKGFHDRLLSDYGKELSGEKNLLFKMKELWYYMIRLFPDHEKEGKKLKKVQHLWEYREIVERLFQEKEPVFGETLFF